MEPITTPAPVIKRRMRPQRAAHTPAHSAAASAPLRVSLDGIRLPLVMLIITTTSRVHQYIGILSKVRPALLLFVWASFMFFSANRKRLALENWRELPVRLVLWLGLAAILSVPFGISVGGAGSYVLNSYSKVIILCLMVTASIQTIDDLWTMVWAYAIGVGTLAWMALTVIHMEVGANGFSRLGEGQTYDANDIGLVCVTGLPLFLITLRTSQIRGKIVSVVFLALACAAIARTGSRGAFLGILAVTVALLFMARSYSVYRRLAVGILGAVTLAFAAPAGYLKQMSTITDPTQDYNWTSSTGRKAVALRGMGYLAPNPVTGIGIANFLKAECTLSEAARGFQMGGAGVKCSAPHNSYLEALVETGVIGGLLFVALVGAGMFCGRLIRKRIRGMHRASGLRALVMGNVAEYLPIAFIGFSIPAFFLSFAYTDLVYLLSAFAAGALGLARRLPQNAAAPAPRLGRNGR